MLKQITEVFGILVLSEREPIPGVDTTGTIAVSILASVFMAESLEEIGLVRWRLYAKTEGGNLAAAWVCKMVGAYFEMLFSAKADN